MPLDKTDGSTGYRLYFLRCFALRRLYRFVREYHIVRYLLSAAVSQYGKHAQQQIESPSFQAQRPLSLHFRRQITAKRTIRFIKTMQGPVGMDNA